MLFKMVHQNVRVTVLIFKLLVFEARFTSVTSHAAQKTESRHFVCARAVNHTLRAHIKVKFCAVRMRKATGRHRDVARQKS